jgi:putative glutamine amidotransferase
MTAFVGLPCCLRRDAEQPFHAVYNKYITAMAEGAGVTPVLIPALGAPPVEILDRLDGLLLTGSPSNIEPHHYQGPAAPEDSPCDPARDSTILPLIRAAVARDIPVLGICRGLQELNVALGGTLHQEVHQIPGRLDHREQLEGSVEHRYRAVHTVALSENGLFARLAGDRILWVNSLHGQGIDVPAADLVTEAIAPDGQIEAVRHATASFVVAVQWHPEWNFRENRFSSRLFAAFGDACRRAPTAVKASESQGKSVRAA